MGFGIHQPYGNKAKVVYSLTQREVGRKHSIWGCNPLFRTAIVCATSVFIKDEVATWWLSTQVSPRSKKSIHESAKRSNSAILAGSPLEEIAQALAVSSNTVLHDLRLAEAWLDEEMRCGRCFLTPERWAQAEELFHRAAECDSIQRANLL